MARLFVIGNYYDVSHGLKTEYKDFKEWLINHYIKIPYFFINHKKFNDSDLFSLGKLPKIKQYDESVYNYCKSDAKNQKIVKNSAINKLIWLCDKYKRYYLCALYSVYIFSYMEKRDCIDYWAKFEEALSKLDIKTLLTELEYNPIKEVLGNGINIERSIPLICKEIFPIWIKKFDIYSKHKFSINNYDERVIRNLDKDTYVLTFNYTETIEKLFNDNGNILHIHGNRKNKEDKLIVGHGDKRYSMLSNGDLSIADEEHDVKFELYKNVNDILDDNKTKSFFDRLASTFRSSITNEIYSYGKSFNDIDIQYIKRLGEILPLESTIWYLNEYDYEDKNKINIIQNIGFKIGCVRDNGERQY